MKMSIVGFLVFFLQLLILVCLVLGVPRKEKVQISPKQTHAGSTPLHSAASFNYASRQLLETMVWVKNLCNKG